MHIIAQKDPQKKPAVFSAGFFLAEQIGNFALEEAYLPKKGEDQHWNQRNQNCH